MGSVSTSSGKVELKWVLSGLSPALEWAQVGASGDSSGPYVWFSQKIMIFAQNVYCSCLRMIFHLFEWYCSMIVDACSWWVVLETADTCKQYRHLCSSDFRISVLCLIAWHMFEYELNWCFTIVAMIWTPIPFKNVDLAPRLIFRLKI